MRVLSIPVAPRQAIRHERALNSDLVEMDRQTFRDLEIFEVEGGARSVFDLIDLTRTAGGSAILRGRMRRPWSRIEKIRLVQDSIRHINGHRGAFDLLPGEMVLSITENYVHSALTLITAKNSIELFMEALEIRFGEVKEYWQIMQGVQAATRMIRSLQRFVEHPDLADAPGELGELCAEVRVLVNLPAFAVLPRDAESHVRAWRLMRIDQILRLQERAAVERLMRLVFELDALTAMADAGRVHGFVLPDVREGSLQILAEGIFHPFLDRPVPNPVRVDSEQRLLFLTGPNMAGKTTYLRACGIATYLAHLGMAVPATSFTFAPCQSLFTAIALVDNVREGISFFKAEALRMKAIARALAAGRTVVGLLDEPFMGTNVKDAFDASHAVLSRLAATPGSLFLVSSHLIELGDPLGVLPHVQCARFEADERGGELQFDYRLRAGISEQRLGVRVLREEGVFDLLDRAARVA